MLKVYSDGGSRGNSVLTGRAYGSYRVEGETQVDLNFPEAHSNNEAEYLSLIAALEMASKKYPSDHICFYTDSKLLVEQVNGRWKCKNPRIQQLRSKAYKLMEPKTWELRWIPRGIIVAQLGH